MKTIALILTILITSAYSGFAYSGSIKLVNEGKNSSSIIFLDIENDKWAYQKKEYVEGEALFGKGQIQLKSETKNFKCIPQKDDSLVCADNKGITTTFKQQKKQKSKVKQNNDSFGISCNDDRVIAYVSKKVIAGIKKDTIEASGTSADDESLKDTFQLIDKSFIIYKLKDDGQKDKIKYCSGKTKFPLGAMELEGKLISMGEMKTDLKFRIIDTGKNFDISVDCYDIECE